MPAVPFLFRMHACIISNSVWSFNVQKKEGQLVDSPTRIDRGKGEIEREREIEKKREVLAERGAYMFLVLQYKGLVIPRLASYLLFKSTCNHIVILQKSHRLSKCAIIFLIAHLLTLGACATGLR